jgi:predicted Zn-dependent protease
MRPRATRRTTLIAALAIGLVGSALVLPGCKRGSIIGTDQEIAIGKDAAQEIEKERKVSKNQSDQKLVDNIGQRVAKASAVDRSGLEYHFKVLEDKNVNAFALPGGWIYVNSGLLDFCKRDKNELGCVLGHEVGHVAKRDGVAIIERNLMAELGVDLLLSGESKSTKNWIDFVRYLEQNGYSRAVEKKADYNGMRYAKIAGYDPRGMIGFLKRLADNEEHRPSDLEMYFRTHPRTEDRIKWCEEHLKELESGGSGG